jgi:uncharacterized membrane protein
MVASLGVFLLVKLVINKKNKWNQKARADRTSTEGVTCMRGSIEIDAAPASVYGLVKQFELYPSVMSFVRAVEPTDDGHLRWTLEGPAGIRIGWDARLTDLTPLRSIAWESLPNPLVSHSGRFDIEELSPERTRLHAELRFGAPLGKPQLYLARLLGMDPNERFLPDLKRIKERIERGASTGAPVRRIYGRGIRERTGDQSRAGPRFQTLPDSRNPERSANS